VQPVPVANPPNPWSTTEVDYLGEPPRLTLQLYEDQSKEILSSNTSPDLGFRWSINPYRGCMHACAYCYARPTHEYLSFGSGTDFDRKIVFKPRAPALLRDAFERRGWKGEPILFSGNTDCYQPLEASYHLTRGCLEVCAEYKNPVHVITKAPLIERDIGILQRLASVAHVSVTVSVPFWNPLHARAIEPYVATPERRMKTVRRLAEAGLRTSVNVAPIIPGLNDEELVAVLEAAAGAGARSAAMTMLRLPGSVKQVFEERLRAAVPLRAERVLARTREVRGGKMNDPRFGKRQTGEGPYAESIAQLFQRTAERLGLSSERLAAAEPESTFERPRTQLELFSRPKAALPEQD